MSVNHYLLPISDIELSSLLEVPERIREFVQSHDQEIHELGEDGIAIATLTATAADDPLDFIRVGASPEHSGWIGKYREEEGRVVLCEVDMGYGPASYYRNAFLQIVAQKLQPFDVEAIGTHEHLNWLEENRVYPRGWLDPWRKDFLKRAFDRYKSCVLKSAESGLNLLVWCA